MADLSVEDTGMHYLLNPQPLICFCPRFRLWEKGDRSVRTEAVPGFQITTFSYIIHWWRKPPVKSKAEHISQNRCTCRRELPADEVAEGAMAARRLSFACILTFICAIYWLIYWLFSSLIKMNGKWKKWKCHNISSKQQGSYKCDLVGTKTEIMRHGKGSDTWTSMNKPDSTGKENETKKQLFYLRGKM